jgi:hypothetical protein
MGRGLFAHLIPRYVYELENLFAKVLDISMICRDLSFSMSRWPLETSVMNGHIMILRNQNFDEIGNCVR